MEVTQRAIEAQAKYGFKTTEQAQMAIKGFWSADEYINGSIEALGLLPNSSCSMEEYFIAAAQLPEPEWEDIFLLA